MSSFVERTPEVRAFNSADSPLLKVKNPAPISAKFCSSATREEQATDSQNLSSSLLPELQGQPYSWSDSRADQIFSTFFGTSNPFQALTDLGPKFSKLAVAAGPRPNSAEQARPLECTLDEIFAGCKKTVRHRREVRF